MHPIDVDEPPSWPYELREHVQGVAGALEETTQHVADLRPTEADCRETHHLLAGAVVKAYHATRLLEHEAAAIREQGLRLLDEQLVVERIEKAFEQGAINVEQRDHLHANHVFAQTFQTKSRADRVCLILSRHTLDEEPDGLWRLLGQWGGEAIYWTQGEAFERELRNFGKPSIVVAGLDLGDPDAGHLIFPGLLHALVGTLLRLQGRGAEIHYRFPIPPAAILDIWQPDNPEFDRHENLWRD